MPRAPGSPAICLNMIVKNEAKVIARCLESVKPLVDAFAIVDTGSTDGTQAIIRSVMAGTPGEVYERPLEELRPQTAPKRSSLARAHTSPGDYLFVIDADDLVVIPPRFAFPPLTKDSYQLRVEDAGTSYLRVHLFRADLDYRYVGVLHEVLTSAGTRTMGRIDGLVYKRTGGGARSVNPNKYRNDAAVLEAALAAEPQNARYAFYLAQSWRDCGEDEKAITAYERRARMGGWSEEVYFSLYEAARLSAKVGKDDPIVIDAYLRAFEFRPTRAEPLSGLAAHLRELGRRNAAYPFARAASEIPRPDDILFVDDSVYAWRALDELAIAAYRDRSLQRRAGGQPATPDERCASANGARARPEEHGVLPRQARSDPGEARAERPLSPARTNEASEASATSAMNGRNGANGTSATPPASPALLTAIALALVGIVVALLLSARPPLPGTGFERSLFPSAACTGPAEVSVVGEPFVPSDADGRAVEGRCERWTARLVAWTKMRARVELTSEPGGSVSIDGRLVVSDEGAHPARTRIGTVDLPRGVHTFVVERVGEAGPALPPRGPSSTSSRPTTSSSPLRSTATRSSSPPRAPNARSARRPRRARPGRRTRVASRSSARARSRGSPSVAAGAAPVLGTTARSRRASSALR